MIRETTSDDKDAILSIIREGGQFDEQGMAYVSETLEMHLSEGSDALWFTADDDKPIGVAYCAPEPVTSGTWNLLMLWIKEEKQKQAMGVLSSPKLKNHWLIEVVGYLSLRLLDCLNLSLLEFFITRSDLLKKLE